MPQFLCYSVPYWTRVILREKLDICKCNQTIQTYLNKKRKTWENVLSHKKRHNLEFHGIWGGTNPMFYAIFFNEAPLINSHNNLVPSPLDIILPAHSPFSWTYPQTPRNYKLHRYALYKLTQKTKKHPCTTTFSPNQIILIASAYISYIMLCVCQLHHCICQN